jgi:phosphoribosyl 1,2-cyclic phosphate phosphodiesterase
MTPQKAVSYFQFLGTGAGEKFPAIWCECETCAVARARGGRNIRSHASAFLGPDVLIDFGPEVTSQAQRFGVELVGIRHLFVTHCHADHLYPAHLFWRRMRPDTQLPPDHSANGPRFSELGILNIYGSSDVVQTLEEYARTRGLLSPLNPDSINENRWLIHEISPLRPGMAGELTYFAVEANHLDRSVNALNYVLRRDDFTIFYGIDTGQPFERTYAALSGFRFNLVVMDATFGTGDGTPRHLNLRGLLDVHARFRQAGLMADGGVFCASHVSPHFAPIHDEYAGWLAAEGVVLAYDGLKIETTGKQ